MAKRVELFYDIVSPYSWLGFEVLCRYQTVWNMNLQLRPVFLGGIMQGAGNKPPGVVPAKAAYMTQDLERLAQHYKLPYRQPGNMLDVIFNKGSLPTMRFLTALESAAPAKLEAVTRALWHRIYSRDEDIVARESLREAGVAAGLSTAEIDAALVSLSTPEVKQKLKDSTDEALFLGAFGAPTIIVHKDDGGKELVFGADRFHVLADLLGETYQGPLNHLAAKL